MMEGDAGSPKSGGKPTFPTSRRLNLRDCSHLEGLSGDNNNLKSDPLRIEKLSGEDHNLNSDQLRVRKVGLPPLFFRERQDLTTPLLS